MTEQNLEIELKEIAQLKTNSDKSVDVVSRNQMNVGDEFVILLGSKDAQPFRHRITGINEQRKESGDYKDESFRRNWANVTVENLGRHQGPYFR